MADQESRGGKKAGGLDPQHPEKHLPVKDPAERPAPGRPGGPKPSTGHSRPEHDKNDHK